jgi:maltooligosyltrehalose trehalohydrolase
MHEFTIWAPGTRKAAVKLGEGSASEEIPMNGPTDRGWWSVSVEQAEPGMDYGFVLDDDPQVYPDPR